MIQKKNIIIGLIQIKNFYILKKFQNQNIIRYLDSFKIQNETQFLSGYTYYVVTEYYKVYTNKMNP